MCMVFNKTGEQWKQMGAYWTSKEIFQQPDIRDTIHIGLSAMGLGSIYETEGKYKVAWTEFSKAIDIFEKYSKGITPELGEVYNHVGLYYQKIGDLFTFFFFLFD